MAFSSEYTFFLRVNEHFTIFLSVLGILGSLILVVIYSRARLRQQSVSSYLCAQALAAILVNLTSIKFYTESKLGFKIVDQSDFSCHLVAFFEKLFPSVCVWLQVLAGIDHLMTLLFSKRFKPIHTVKFKIFLILILVILNGCVVSHVVADNNLREYYNILTKKTLIMCANFIDFENVYLEAITLEVLPILIILASSVPTLVAVLASRKKALVSKETSDSQFSHREFGITILTMNVAFVFFKIPHSITNFCFLLVKEQWWVATEWFFVISLSFSILNNVYFASLLLLQLGSNSLVRNEFCELRRK